MGVADILDFSRVMLPAGLEHTSPLEAPGYYVRCELRTLPANLAAAPSSAAILAFAARFLRFLGPAEPGFFALRQIGLLCLLVAAILFAGGLAAGLRPWLAVGLLYVLVDPGYLFFFNSFYADGALFLGLLGAVIWLDRLGHLPWTLLRRPAIALAAWLAMVLILLLGGGSKMLFVLLPAVFLLGLAPRLLALFRESRLHALTWVVTIAALQALVFWNFFYGAGPRFLEFNNFHAVYGGILRVSSDPGRVFDRLGIPEEHRSLAREDAWTAGVGLDHPVHQHLRQLSRLQLLRFYLEDPPALAKTLGEIADALLLVASHPRGTYPRLDTDSHPVKRIYGETWQFSNLTRQLYGQRRWVPAALLALAVWRLAAVARRGAWSGAAAARLFLLLWFFSQCALAVLGEGFVNLHQHLVGARLALDFLVVMLVLEAAGAFFSRIAARAGTGGTNPG